MTTWGDRKRGHCLELERIMREVCVKHQVAPIEFLSCHRQSRLVRARQEACWRARIETKASYITIGEVFERHYSSVMHHVRRHALKLNAAPRYPHESQIVEAMAATHI